MALKQMLSSVGNLFRKVWDGGPPRSASAVSSNMAVQYLLAALRSNAPGAWSDNRLEQTNHFTGAAFIAINTLMKQAAAAELLIYERDPEEPENKKQLSHREDVVKLFESPNPRDDFGMFMRRAIQQLGLTGSALVWAVPNGLKVPCEMYVIPTALAYPMPQFAGFPNGAYRVQPMYPYGPFAMWPGMNTAAGAVIPADQIFAIKNPHPLLTYEGYSDLTAMRLQADTVESIDRARWNTQQKGVEPSGVLTLPEDTANPAGPDMARIRAELEAFWEGPLNKGKMLVVGGGATAQPWGTAPADMAWQEGWDQLIGFLFGGYGVMKAVAGVTDAASFAQLYAAIKQFNLMSLCPLLKMVSGAFNKFLMPRFNEDYRCELNPEKIDDPSVEQGINTMLVQSGAVTNNELRVRIGMEKTEEEWGEERAGSPVQTKLQVQAEKDKAEQDKQAASAQQAQQLLSAAQPSENAEPQNPVEVERPDNPEGEGSLGPRLKSLNGAENGNSNGHNGSIIAKTFDPLKHPRGQPDNAGKFGPGSSHGGTGSKPTETETVGKGSMGDVRREGDEAVKSGVLPDGSESPEGRVYAELAGVEGIAPGFADGNEIRLPFYKNIVGVDTIPEKQRHTLAPMIYKQRARINCAITAVSEAGFNYNDPLQFGVSPDRQFNLLDFSNVMEESSPEEALSYNIGLLKGFYEQFGLAEEAKRIGVAYDALAGMRLILRDEDGLGFWEDEIGKPVVDKLKAQLNGVEPKYAYYATNARHVGIGGIAQTESDKGVKVILSQKPLDAEQIAKWELTPVIHPPAKAFASSQKSATDWHSGKSLGPHEYASTQLPITGDVAAKLREFSRGLPRRDLADGGIERDLHLTILYGLEESSNGNGHA